MVSLFPSRSSLLVLSIPLMFFACTTAIILDSGTHGLGHLCEKLAMSLFLFSNMREGVLELATRLLPSNRCGVLA